MRFHSGGGRLILTLIFAAFAGACQSPPGGQAEPTRIPADGTSEGASAKPVAYVNGEAVRRDALFEPLLEAAGGEVFSELVLERLIEQRLADRDQALSEQDLAAERERVLATLDPEDEDEAARLLRELRGQRGLGEQRFESLLRRNAGLRKLVADRVEVTDEAVRQAFQRRYGERYRVRLIVVDSFNEASRLRRQAIEGEAAFSDLAAEHSTDVSADRGGLLSPISPADPSYPRVLRDALVRLDRQGQPVSEVLALDGQFALVRLEEKIEAEAVELVDVREALTRDVRRQLQRRQMEQLARRLLSEANVVILDRTLTDRWSRQRESLLNP
ncbi:MAG: peptidylprolyl isomerase [Phycisphaeraceae bacterium]